MPGLSKVLFVKIKWPRDTDPHGETEDRKKGSAG